VFQRFIARQAILNDNLSLLGYSLRFRPPGPQSLDADEAASNGGSGSSAAYVIDSSTMVFHWESLTGNGLAFIKLNLQELLSGAALILPRTKTVIEIPSTSPCTSEVLLACKNLKAAGYRLALSNWTGRPDGQSLAMLADYLLADLQGLQTPPEQALAGQRDAKPALIAYGVNTWDDHRKAREFGISHFKGDFFMKPQLLRRRDVAGTRRNSLRLLRAILKDQLDLPQIEAIVREEPALAYKLLRYLNSPVMERKVEVRSIRNAISLLGEQEFRRWASLVAVITPATGKTSELLRAGLMRAYFCEQLAIRGGDAAHAYDYFFTGLFSVMDAVLDRELCEIVDELALSADVRQGLLGESGKLHEALQAAKAYEDGRWAPLSEAMQNLRIADVCAPECFELADKSVNAILT
jgi:c-di-GMP-related signal transduction protein